MRYFIIAVLLAFAMSCGSKTENKDKTEKSDKTEKLDRKDTIGEIITKDEHKDPNYDLKAYQTTITSETGLERVFGNNYKSWTPSDSDIEQAEKLFKKGFVDQARGTVNRVLYRTRDDYYRQYVGAIDSAGDKIIWINCFCKSEVDHFKEWKNKLAMVKDGGNCFINVTVNLTKNDYTRFDVNGNG